MVADWLFAIESQADIDDILALVAWHNTPHMPSESLERLPSGRAFPYTPIEHSHIIVAQGASKLSFAQTFLARQGTQKSMLLWGSPLIYSGVILHEGRLYARYFVPYGGNEVTLFLESYCPVPVYYPRMKPDWYLDTRKYKFVSFATDEATIPRFFVLQMRALSDKK